MASAVTKGDWSNFGLLCCSSRLTAQMVTLDLISMVVVVVEVVVLCGQGEGDSGSTVMCGSGGGDGWQLSLLCTVFVSNGMRGWKQQC